MTAVPPSPRPSVPPSAPAVLTAAALTQLGLGFALEKHPAIPQIPVEAFLAGGLKAADILPMLRERHNMIAAQKPKTPGNEVGDPLRHGWEPAIWGRVRKVIADIRAENADGVVEILLMGGWRSGKTEYCAKTLMQMMVEKPGTRAWFLQETETASQHRQQSRLWDYFPAELKNVETGRIKRRVDLKIQYKDGDGFTKNMFVLPNAGPNGRGSMAEGKFYAAKEEAMQGEELDIAWADELIPAKMVKTLRGRLFQRNGLLLVSFTPIKGYNDTVAEWLNGVEMKDGIPLGYAVERLADGTTRYQGVEEWAEAPLLPVKNDKGAITGYERVPVVLRCRDRMRAVVWFHNSENFYGNYPGLVNMLKEASRETILIQAYGIPTKKFGAVFQFYETNVVSDDGRRQLLERADQFTWYHVLDPAGTGAARNPFQQWWAVAANGQKICVREWPQPKDYIPGVGDDHGVWAESGAKADGEKGPAVEWFGFGLEKMSDEIKRVEEELAELCPALKATAAGGKPRIKIHERYMDSRAGHTTTLTSTGAVTLIEQWELLPPEHRLYFLPAAGDGGDNWKIILQMQLEKSAKIEAPELMVCECCANTIFGLRNWTSKDGMEGACKDPVDCTHYIVSLDPQWVQSAGTVPQGLRGTGGGGGGWSGYGPRK